MSRLTFTGVVGHPRDDVWAWHERPGAVERLTPPWLPVRVRREAPSLDNGEAVLGFPLGLRWVARHTGATPPERFVDELVSAPLRWGVRWRHTHELHDEGDRTRVTDTLDTNVPEALVREMFAYRHRQLCLDLATQASARAAGDRPLVVAMTGSSGLVGGALAPFLTTAGHRVVRLVRGTPRGPDERRWDPQAPAEDLLRGVDAVIHLAGASIAGRFTDEHRAAVRDSRTGPTRALAELAGRTPDGPRVFVSASAIGFYGPQRGDEELTETSPRGDGFLADVVTDWEDAAALAADAGLRVVTVRTGLVQSPRGGTLRLFRPLFAAGLGGRLGSGRAWQSWIGIDDLVDVYHRALYDPTLTGPVNAVAPHPVRNDAYAATLARVLRRPALVPVPRFGPRLLLGAEGATEVAEASQRVYPAALLAAGHRFRHPMLEPALRHLLGRPEPA
ncbi:TIGR01777 family oxidoreductase [Promicromonospora citrea]|uniref:Nucleoside-diphosphate sugar epimerase n=1 Tax=Promicromonospora citrea TaxID=43677 RepID=A0A8H9L451_9MICO|nr:TIGR01777 family oxidoreductase [Promicromonospora citrea]NNH53924.1 TIGR01777 family protein [Promicromonospora citrea]GGM17785.1 nucleoside-diphosphate sugar epimerase [Promicromonospora citrea]